MTVFFKYYSCIILSERAKVFIEVLHFYNSEAKRLLMMVLAVKPIEPWFLKSCMNKALRIMRMCALWTEPDVHYWLSIPRNKHWTLGLSDISQY